MSRNSLSFFTKVQILVFVVLLCSMSSHTCLLGSSNLGNETIFCRRSILQNQNENQSSHLFAKDVNNRTDQIVGTLAYSVENPHNRPVLKTVDNIVASVVIEPNLIERIEEFIKEAGYPVDRHQVTTNDGYILNVFRIPHGKRNNTQTGKRQPIYIGHGLDSSAADWIVQGENKSLPYILADEGYDVWLANSRGNAFARGHTHLAGSDRFWNYSVHEMGKYDVPATIDYILEKTNSKKLNYIGYSMSTTSYFICMSENPKYNDKVNKAVMIAPAVYLTNVNNIGRLISEVPGVDQLLTNDPLTGGQLYTDTVIELLNQVGRLCTLGKLYLPLVCTFVLDLMAGETNATTDKGTIKNAAEFFPTSSSGKTLAHYLQFFRREFFGHYDTRLYVRGEYVGGNSPQQYRLNATTGDILVIYGKTDKLTTEKDVNRLIMDLAKANRTDSILIPGFNHLNFIYANEAAVRVYTPIVRYFNSKNQI